VGYSRSEEDVTLACRIVDVNIFKSHNVELLQREWVLRVIEMSQVFEDFQSIYLMPSRWRRQSQFIDDVKYIKMAPALDKVNGGVFVLHGQHTCYLLAPVNASFLFVLSVVVAATF